MLPTLCCSPVARQTVLAASSRAILLVLLTLTVGLSDFRGLDTFASCDIVTTYHGTDPTVKEREEMSQSVSIKYTVLSIVDHDAAGENQFSMVSGAHPSSVPVVGDLVTDTADFYVVKRRMWLHWSDPLMEDECELFVRKIDAGSHDCFENIKEIVDI